MNRDRMFAGARWLIAGGLALGLVWVPVGHADDAAQPSPTAPAPTATATASAVGLLPIHGVTVDLDALPGAGKGKDKSDVVALQQLWDSYLKGGGFNAIGFTVDVHDLGERGAGRVARMCEWAKQNNVRIAPNLAGAPDGKPLPADYATLAASFVGKVIATLGPAGAASYSQITLYQLGRPLNHPASHGPIEAAAAGATLKAAAEAVRAAEQAGLAQSGIQASPLLVPVSFDYELIRRGAIVHTAISDESYGAAYEALRDYLLTVLGAAPVEAVSVEWFPGSLSSDGVDRMPDLMTRLQADLPGKLLVMDTGYSSAAGSDTSQARFYALALNNLCDLRARQGVESPFAGILWRNALDSGTGEGKRLTPEQISQQDWGERSNELTAMWNDPKAGSKETRSWLAGIQSHFGMISRSGSSGSGLAPKTAYLVMSRLETALASSPEASDALAAVKELVGPGKGGGQQLKSRLQSAMLGMLDMFLAKTAENLFTTAPEPAPLAATPGQPVPLPDLVIMDAGPLPTTSLVSTPISIPVTIFNAGAASAMDACVYLRDKKSDLAHSNPTAILPGGTITVQLQWTPTQPGQVPGITLDAFCSNEADPQTNHAEMGDVHVSQASTPPKPPRDFGGLVTGVRPTKATATVSTKTDPGFVRIDDLSTTLVMSSPTSPKSSGGDGGGKVMMAPAPGSGSGGTGGTTAAGGAVRSGTSSSSSTSTSTSRPIAPAPATMAATPPAPTVSPITMTLVNPFNTSFLVAVATLRVDGQKIATRPLGTLLPGQRRTVSFTEWKPAKAGSYRVQVDLEGMAAGGKRLTSTASSQVVVVGGESGTSMAAAAGPATPPSPVPARPVGGTRSLVPMVRAASAATVPSFGARPLGGSRGLGVRSFAGGVAFGLTANSIVLNPFPPTPGAPLEVSVRLTNMDGTPAAGARVQVSVDGEDLGFATVDVPGSGTAIASGFRPWTVKPGRHDFHASVIAGNRKGEATKAVLVTGAGATRGLGRPMAGMPPGRSGAVVGAAPVAGGPRLGGLPSRTGTLQPGFRPTTGLAGAAAAPDLQLLSSDIRIAPATPAEGTAAVVSVNVRNLGGAAATDGRVLLVLLAAGKEVTRRQFPAPVPARGALPLQWPITAPAGALVVTATATVTGDANPNNNQARSAAAIKTTFERAPLRAPTTISR